jgi:hypothetical protein
MIIPGTISLVFGLIFLVTPKRLMWGNMAATRPSVETDAWFLTYHVSTGLCLAAAGIFCLVSAFYVWLRVHS